MKCINCNVSLPDGATECHLCGAKVTEEVIRCPKCFIKLEKNAKICHKCGFDIEGAANKKGADTPVKKDKKKTLIFSLIPLICIALIVAAYSAWYSVKFADFKKETSDFVAFVDENIENITILASGYEEIYNGQWIIYAENISALEENNKQAIDALIENRDKITYLANEAANKALNEKDELMIREVAENYNNCYLYVVAKKGTYPGYMDGYEKHLSEYEKSVKRLNKRIK